MNEHETDPAAKPNRGKDKVITYFVNGEEESTTERKVTVKEVLTRAGFTPVEDYDLTSDAGNQTFSDPAEVINIHQGERFTATFTGTTPTS